VCGPSRFGGAEAPPYCPRTLTPDPYVPFLKITHFK
jgi:hypothetical protein